jgi:hypothetical protein
VEKIDRKEWGESLEEEIRETRSRRGRERLV